VYILASLPESFKMLITALEANSYTDVPSTEAVKEFLLHEERKKRIETILYQVWKRDDKWVQQVH